VIEIAGTIAGMVLGFFFNAAASRAFIYYVDNRCNK
jgi:hypothetical protein